MKVMVVSDVHLSPRTPSSRKDDYSESILNKVKGLSKLGKDLGVSDIIFLGDLFNTKHMTLPYFIKCFQVFKDLQEDFKLHLIVGNHDIYYNNDATMEDSPIQLLLDSGVFTNDTFSLGKTTFHLFNYTTPVQEVPKVENKDTFNILVGHYFYNLGFDDVEHTITKDLAEELGYDSYLLGHDHTVYDEVKQKTYIVHRPGSLTRTSSSIGQVVRDEIDVLVVDTETTKISYHSIYDVVPSKDVFKESNLISKVTMHDIDESLKELLSSLDFDNSSDIIETLESIDMSDEVSEVVYSYLSDVGVYRKEVDI